jgi:hypothetical protein
MARRKILFVDDDPTSLMGFEEYFDPLATNLNYALQTMPPRLWK